MSSLTSWLMFGEHYACKASSCVPQFIGDPALRFWFHVFSPHRTRWPAYDQAERGKLIHDHASTVFEDYCRARHPGAARYWESSLEFDCVRVDQGAAVVTEVKFRKLSAGERSRLETHLAEGWQRSVLSKRFRNVRFEILDPSVLASPDGA